MLCEDRVHDKSCFVTLTFDDEHLPFDLSLDVRHWQLFAKRLRKWCPDRIRYFMCGEYGELGGRAHYHAILWGVDFAEDRTPYKQTPYGMLDTSPTLERLWGQGFVTIGDVTPQSCGYVAGYIQKKQFGERARHAYATAYEVSAETGLVEPTAWRKAPFATMSRRPGIGAKYLERYGHEVYAHDQVVVDGKARQPPRYFDAWLEQRDPEKLELFKAERQKRSANRWRDQLPERQVAREKVHQHANGRHVREPGANKL